MRLAPPLALLLVAAVPRLLLPVPAYACLGRIPRMAVVSMAAIIAAPTHLARRSHIGVLAVGMRGNTTRIAAVLGTITPHRSSSLLEIARACDCLRDQSAVLTIEIARARRDSGRGLTGLMSGLMSLLAAAEGGMEIGGRTAAAAALEAR